jgi:formylglycine-generating enzyme required for sulfatase activity
LEHLLAGDANPDRRTAFIHGYPRWGADPLALERLLETAGLVPEHGGLRSGVCAALGLMSGATNTLPPPALDRLRGRLKRLWAEAPDAGTRGAAAYALVRWGGGLPALPAPAREPAPGRDWFVNEAGLTLVRIPAPERPAGTPDPPPQSFGYRDEWELIPRPFFMSDREITVAQFKAYRAQVGADPQTPPGEVPGRWEGDPSDLSPTPDCPAHSVSWAAAAAYCNWLSRQEGRGACYRVAGTTDWQNPTNWVCDLSVSGYRLPTWAEWRHACAAGSREDFAFGSDPQLLGEYATYAGNYVRTLIPAGGRLPNRWGLFDVHGSVREWAHEWVRLEDVQGARNPERGGVRPQLVSGGGSWAQPASYCRIEMALRDETKHWEIGFRVVLVEARAPDRRGDPAR